MKTLSIALVAACGTPAAPAHPSAKGAQLSVAADAQLIVVPGGQFIIGSTPEERAVAYDEFLSSAGNDGARTNKWFDREEDRHLEKLGPFRIDLRPVTQVEYAEFVTAGKAPAPAIDEAAWIKQGFAQEFATQVARFNWIDGRPPHGKEDHPVVLVTWDEAQAYCAWRGTAVGEPRRLPTRTEYEKASRGEHGFIYPWSNVFEADKLNSAVGGPGDTTPSGSIAAGASPYGVLELAGNVFQWTSSPAPEAGEMLVKGSAWEDFAGLGRGASAHGRKKTIRHVIVGFRCAADAPPPPR